jgi:hypothetical protein
MQPNACEAWQNFIAAKGGCYKPTPLKGITHSRFRRARKELWVICSKFFMLPGRFIFGVVAPLYFADLDDLTVTRSAVSKILIALSLYDRSPPRSSYSIGIYSSGTRKHFLSYDMWNTSCTSDSCGGSSS